MKHLFKSLAVFFFVFAVLACQDDSNEILDGSTNKHDNARISSVLDVSGTTTLTYPGYDYDVIRPAAGTYLTLGNGVRWNSFDWSNLNGGTATINIPSSSTVQSFGTVTIPTGVNYYISGRSFNYGLVHLTGGLISSSNEHYPSGGLKITSGNYAHSFSAITVGGQLYGNGGTYTFSSLPGGKATFDNVYVNGTGNTFIFGNGRMTFTNGGEVWVAALTGSSTTKICLPNGNLHFYASAVLGPGSYSCP